MTRRIRVLLRLFRHVSSELLLEKRSMVVTWMVVEVRITDMTEVFQRDKKFAILIQNLISTIFAPKPQGHLPAQPECRRHSAHWPAPAV